MENQTANSARQLENLTGEFNATFTNNIAPGEARFPYHSQTLQSSMPNVTELLDFDSQSGVTAAHPSFTNDKRSIRMTLNSNITSGTYTFPQDEVIRNVTYGEVKKFDPEFQFTSQKATKAELKLNITENGRRYSGELNFEVVNNGETLTITSTFDVVLHFKENNSGQLDSSTASFPQGNVSAADLQNITGEFNAKFPVSLTPGETPFARAHYHSSSLRYDTLSLTQDINFSSRSGNLPLDSDITSDARGFEIHLEKGITSGTYSYPSLSSPIKNCYTAKCAA
ncbi:hypothetical protein NN484_25290 [Pseudomonas serboccidentalis]|uniref:Uncharacterized protein n=1 Tax=Pseudomonas serboccidentalis TaxID=2964670 RepID=A0ABY7Z9A6_9PSED|nr:hypothetical protein [Pseudomonas serboccidentalis]WDR35766.1 hypothetical protein NN484_25290 [Pseudomonas serboccidentalis]